MTARERFFHGEHCPRNLSIIAVLLGGSIIYRGEENEYRYTSDWDGVLIVASKLEIFTLVNKHRLTLLNMFDIACEEHPRLSVPDPSSEEWDYFDAVRFAGFTRTGTKKSVKILSQEYFAGSRTSLNILSFKDKRIYEGYESNGTTYYRIHQASRPQDGLCILHDQWIFKAKSSYCTHNTDISRVKFGVTADLLVTGNWLLGGPSYGDIIQKQLLRQYVAVSNRHATTDSFARSNRFCPKFKLWLADRLASLNSTISLSVHRACACQVSSDHFLYGSTPSIACKLSQDKWSRTKRLPANMGLTLRHMDLSKKRPTTKSIFTSNSISYTITLETYSTENLYPVTKAFCKTSKFQEQEIRGAEEASL